EALVDHLEEVICIDRHDHLELALSSLLRSQLGSLIFEVDGADGESKRLRLRSSVGTPCVSDAGPSFERASERLGRSFAGDCWPPDDAQERRNQQNQASRSE